jgi:hypothetical protein
MPADATGVPFPEPAADAGVAAEMPPSARIEPPTDPGPIAPPEPVTPPPAESSGARVVPAPAFAPRTESVPAPILPSQSPVAAPVLPPAVVVPPPATLASPVLPPPTIAPVPPPRPPIWSGRATVPGAAPALVRTATPAQRPQSISPYGHPPATIVAPAVRSPYPPLRRRGRVRRLFGALFALLLLLAVPVVSAYVAYKLASGENPFEWPPSMDLSRVF